MAVKKPTPTLAGIMKKQTIISENLANDLQELKNLRKETKAVMQKIKDGRVQVKWPDVPASQ